MAVNVGGTVRLRALLLAVWVALAAAGRVAAAPSLGDLPILVVLAGFPDRPLANDRAYFATLIDRLVAYYAEVSSGRLRIVPHIGGPVVTLPEARPRYVGRPADMARDALREFARVAVDPADTRALAEAQGTIVFFAGPGRESHVTGGDPTDPWSNYASLVPPVGKIRDATVIAETEVPPFSPFGVLTHEFGHLLRLPELYAPGGASHEGIGVWGLMGQGTWLGRGEEPPHLDAWSKMRLGWVDVDTIERTTAGVRVPAVTREPRVVRIPVSPGNQSEYYLLENRLREGADARIPGEGLLVWHVDEGRWAFRAGQHDPAHKLLHLVEADGRGDLDRGHAAGGNRGDETDPWVGPPAWRRWAGAALGLLGALLIGAAVLRLAWPRPLGAAALCVALGGAALAAAGTLRRGPVCGPGTPGMAPYDGRRGRVVLRNFSPAGPEMRVDVLVEPEAAAP